MSISVPDISENGGKFGRKSENWGATLKIAPFQSRSRHILWNFKSQKLAPETLGETLLNSMV